MIVQDEGNKNTFLLSLRSMATPYNLQELHSVSTLWVELDYNIILSSRGQFEKNTWSLNTLCFGRQVVRASPSFPL